MAVARPKRKSPGGVSTGKMSMFHRLPTVCIVFCVVDKYILINCINRPNLIFFF
jgi:hypothetical protein